MTAREYLNKYPQVERLVERTVGDAKARQLSSSKTTSLLRSRMKTELKLVVPKWMAEEFLIA